MSEEDRWETQPEQPEQPEILPEQPEQEEGAESTETESNGTAEGFNTAESFGPVESTDVGKPAPAFSYGPGPVNGTRALAEGAMLTALTLILAVISLYVPVLNIVAQFFFPAPLALLVLRHGLKFGFIGAASVFLLSAILLGLPHAIYLFILYGFLGLFFGWCFRTGKKAIFTLLVGVLLASLAMLVLLIFPTYILGVGPDQFKELLTSMFSNYMQMAGPQGTAMFGGMSVQEVVDYSLRMLPSILFLLAMGLTLVCYLLMGRLLRRLRYDIPKLPPFREWRLDWRLLWLLIISMFSSSLGDRLHIPMITQIANNLLSAFVIIFMVFGFSVLFWVFGRYKLNNVIKVLAVLLLLQLFSGMLVVLVGVFDPLFDFRRRLEKRTQKRGS